jgi:hypothetical protein
MRHEAVDHRQRRAVETVGVVEQQHRDAGLALDRGEQLAAASKILAKSSGLIASSSPNMLRARAGIRWATAPNATAPVERSAVARSTRRPAAAASATHSSPRRVLPTPGGP